MCAKVFRTLEFLKYAKKLQPQKTFSHIYRGIVEPYFRYCGSVCGSYGEARLLTLQKLHKSAVRIERNSSYDAPADALIQKLNWPKIAEISKRETVTVVYTSLNGLVPAYLSKIYFKELY